MVEIPTQELPSGDEFPLVGFGTYSIDSDETTAAVQTALDAGYRHIDCAEGYKNESAVGDAIADYDREDLFLTSKVLPSNLSYESVLSACGDSLDRLGTDYLDLYLIHWPNPAVSLRETLDALATLYDDGKVRNIGVSNFTAYQLMFAQHISDVPIGVTQAEFHPWFQQPELSEYCDEEGITLTAATPLARTRALGDDVVQELAEAYEKTPAQITLRWQVQQGVATIPRSTNKEHIQSNLAVCDWRLDSEDMSRIDGRNRNERQYMIDVNDETYGISR
jgi:diketogulonate reductase-like aldo/keto reductase